MKRFIITIDTEGDNLWAYNIGQPITTENAKFLPRFQNLCTQYGFKPTYLTNYEMIKDTYFVNFALKELKKGACEIGMHLHAWNNPPLYDLTKGSAQSGLPYLIEYPKDSMSEKVSLMIQELRTLFGNEIVSHRSGRWAMNQDYFDLLIDNNLRIDCSVTPHVSWESTPGFSLNSAGTDYSSYPEHPYYVHHSSNSKSLLEVPVTIRKTRFQLPDNFTFQSIKKSVKILIKEKIIWLRPKTDNLKDMLYLTERIKNSEDDYLMFMLHSSELMPGGSPTFKTVESIEKLYHDLEILFKIIAKYFLGSTLKEYAKSHK